MLAGALVILFCLSQAFALLCIKHPIKRMIKKLPQLQVAVRFIKSNGGEGKGEKNSDEPSVSRLGRRGGGGGGGDAVFFSFCQ